MMNAMVLTVLLAARFAAIGANEVPQIPPLPARTVVTATPVFAPRADLDDPAPAGTRAKAPATPTIKTGEKQLNNEPFRDGIGEIAAGGGDAKAKGNHLYTVINEAAYAHCFPTRHHSNFASSVQLVQEFEVAAGSRGAPWVSLSMGARLHGYLRSEKRGAAFLRRADAVVFGPDGSPCVQLGFAPEQTSGDSIVQLAHEDLSPSAVVRAGHFVLVVTLVVETTTEGCFRSHAEAIFTPGRRTGTWKSHADNEPPEVNESEDFGLAVTVVADPPPRR